MSPAIPLQAVRGGKRARGPPVFKKDSLVRFPLRLGDDAFQAHRISVAKRAQLVRVMVAFRNLMDAYSPLAYRACATSALREAKNRSEVVRAVRQASGITLEVISGRDEAEIIYANRSERNLKEKAAYLYIDVGGGSTQLTLFFGGLNVASCSFDIGTVRILKDLVPATRWREMRAWISQVTNGREPIGGIGSGGNINKIFMMAGARPGRPVTAKILKELTRRISAYDLEDRVRVLGLRPDRADVIVPALTIFRRVMKWAGVPKIYVPFIGLADGLVHQLYEDHVRARDGRPLAFGIKGR